MRRSPYYKNGVAIAAINGILERVFEVFPEFGKEDKNRNKILSVFDSRKGIFTE
jgi:hypothetical protein